MLYLDEFIGEGSVRACYRHPARRDKCVKVAKRPKDVPDLLREAEVAELTGAWLKEFTIQYDPAPVETDKGPGLVCDLVCDGDGSVSPALAIYLKHGGRAAAIEQQLNCFVRRLIENDLFFYDFNLGNLVVQSPASGEKRLYYVDLKSLHRNGYCGFLKLELFFAPFARHIMFRRLRHVYRELGLAFPFRDLCRKKSFESLFVRVKLKKRSSGDAASKRRISRTQA